MLNKLVHEYENGISKFGIIISMVHNDENIVFDYNMKNELKNEIYKLRELYEKCISFIFDCEGRIIKEHENIYLYLNKLRGFMDQYINLFNNTVMVAGQQEHVLKPFNDFLLLCNKIKGEINSINSLHDIETHDIEKFEHITLIIKNMQTQLNRIIDKYRPINDVPNINRLIKIIIRTNGQIRAMYDKLKRIMEPIIVHRSIDDEKYHKKYIKYKTKYFNFIENMK